MFLLTTSAVVRQCLVVFTINLNCLPLGMGLVWSSPVLVKLSNESQTVLSQPITEEQASWVVSISFLCGGIGYLLASVLIDCLGRKYCVIMSSVVKLASSLLYIFATEVWMLILGRAVNGLSEGLLLAVVPVYASEIASKKIRGALGTVLQIAAVLGSLVMLGAGPLMTYFSVNLMLTMFILLTSLPMLVIPDSPYYLFSKGKKEEAMKVLVFLRGSEALATEEMDEYPSPDKESKPKLTDILKNKLFLKSLAIASFIIIMVYMVGFNCILSYLQTILVSTGAEISSELCSAIIGCIQVVASMCTMFMSDKFGRKPIISITLIGMALGTLLLGVFFQMKQKDNTLTGFMNYLPLISLALIVYCYAAGLGSLMWVLTAELFDDVSRGVGVSLTLLMGVLPSFLIMRFFTKIIATIGPAYTFWLCGIMSIVLSLFILFCVPETKGKTFKEIQDILGGTNEKNVEKC